MKVLHISQNSDLAAGQSPFQSPFKTFRNLDSLIQLCRTATHDKCPLCYQLTSLQYLST